MFEKCNFEPNFKKRHTIYLSQSNIMFKHRFIYLTLLLFLGIGTLGAQSRLVEGTVKDSESGEGLPGATVSVKNTNSGTISGTDGAFSVSVSGSVEKVTIIVSYIGFKTVEMTDVVPGTPVDVSMEPSALSGEEVIVSASKYSERVLESPATVQSISAVKIQSSASGDYFQSLGNLPQIDIVDNSFNFKVFNTRGFNSTIGYRTVQFIDGTDNLSAGISFAPGTFMAIPDIDLRNVELISGPASCLYGSNALQGVVSMTSKSPFDAPGFSVKVMGGTRTYMGLQARYAGVFGKKQKFGFKVAAAYNRADDWMGDDPVANVYKYVGSNSRQNIGGLLGQYAADTVNFTAAQRQLFTDFQQYAANNPTAGIGNVNHTMPGYKESDLYSGLSENLKVNAALHYRFNSALELQYGYRMARGSSVFQGNNRSFFDHQLSQQHRVELRGRQFYVRGYVTIEDLGDAYAFNGSGANLGLSRLSTANRNYALNYVQTLAGLTNGFAINADSAMIAQSQAAGVTGVSGSWLVPGTEEFNTTFEAIKNNPARPQGAKFINNSYVWHAEGQYDFSVKNWFNVNIGGSYRLNVPNTYGSVLSDTLLPDGTYDQRIYYETGGFVQLSRSFFDEKLRLLGSLRVDKSNYFDPQFSPRFAVMLNLGRHHLRVAAQSAFRNPAQNEQFFRLNAGAVLVLGNTTGFSNLYTLTSATNFLATGNADTLVTTTLPPVRPENLKTIEFGYRAIPVSKLFVDFNFYYNVYQDFIGRINVAHPKNGVAGEQSGIADLQSGQFDRWSIIVNSNSTIKSWGTSLALQYEVAKGINVYGNYTLSKLVVPDVKDPLVPGYNTPEHKFNLGVEARKVWKGLGFGANFRWSEGYLWESPFATGQVPSFHTLDLQVSYEIEKWHSAIRLGGSNIYNNEHIEAFGGGRIGAFYYASWMVNL